MFKKMLQSLVKNAPEMTQLIIIDNNSESKLYTTILDFEVKNIEVLVLVQNENIGFGKAHNLATQRASGEYIAYINDDVKFYEVWTTPMLEILQHDSNVMQVGMKQDTCSKLDITASGRPALDSEEIDYIEASCMMMRTYDAKCYGPFNDEYEHAYYEDADLSMRIKRDGHKIAQVDVDWKHYRAKTSTNDVKDVKGFHAKNRYRFQKEWMSYLVAKKFGACIVVRRTGSIGDVFLTLPVIRELRKLYVEPTIILATSNPQAVVHSSLIDLITTAPFYPIPCDRFVDLDNAYERDFRGNIVQIYAEKADVAYPVLRENFSASTATIERIKKLIDVDDRYVALELSDTWKEKQWPYDNYKELARRISGKGFKVVLFGKCDYRKPKYIKADKDFVNQLDITETGVLLSAMKCFIGHEGLSLHLAQASNIPSIGLYGCTLPQYTNDMSSDTLHPVITKAECRGCRHRHCAGNSVLCPRNAECMGMITVDEVWEKFLEVMK